MGEGRGYNWYGWVRVGGITGVGVGEGREYNWYGGGWVRVGGITGLGWVGG